MAKFTSKYKELAFYVGVHRKQFSGGVYVTEDKGEIAALGLLRDVSRVAEDKPKAKPAAKK